MSACAATRGRGQGHVLLAPLSRLADLALPPRCPGCGAVTAADHRFCVTCWNSLRFLGPPWCAACHLPFDFDRGEGALCGKCLEAPPPYSGVRSAVAYGDVARTVALKLKYSRRMACAETMARAMQRVMPEEGDMLVPVPLHRWRIWSRGFNQSQLIAKALAKTSALPVEAELLLRHKATPVLKGLGNKGRRKAVQGAFALAPDAKAKLSGKVVLLVDDVHTSGATAAACTKALLRGGAKKVILLCWARVLDNEAVD